MKTLHRIFVAFLLTLSPALTWAGNDLFDPQELEKLREKLLAHAPENIPSYDELVTAEDRRVLQRVQASLFYMMDRIADRQEVMKNLLVRGLVSYTEYRETDPKMALQIAQDYRTYLKNEYSAILGHLMGSVDAAALKLGRDAKGDLVEVLLAREAGDKLLYRDSESSPVASQERVAIQQSGFPGMTFALAQGCETEMCVYEIQSIAKQFLLIAEKWDRPVRFSVVLKNPRPFLEVKDIGIRRYVSNYLRTQIENKDRDAFVGVLARITEIGFLTVSAPVQKLPSIRTSIATLNFDPLYFKSRFHKFNSEMPAWGYALPTTWVIAPFIYAFNDDFEGDSAATHKALTNSFQSLAQSRIDQNKNR